MGRISDKHANPKSKLPDVGTTIFTVMSEMAQEHNALNLSQGFPDFDTPAALLERVSHYLNSSHNQYAPMPGVPALRQAIAAKLMRCYQVDADADAEITVTSGATEALFSAINAFVGRGDEVIVFDPAYDSYDPAIRLAGGTAVHLPLRTGDFSVDWELVRNSVTPRTRMIVVNSPHNPTGAVFSEQDLRTLSAIACEHDLLVLSDEVYEHIIFDGLRHESVLRLPELRQRSLSVSSFGKTYHATGWKIGYVVAPPELTREFRKVHQFNQFTVVTPMQFALADYLNDHPEHDESLPAFYQAKRDHFCELLKDSRFTLSPAKGTYFQLLDYSDISDKPDTLYVEELTRKAGISAIPISVFSEDPGRQRLLRFCFAKSEATLEKAAEILCRI